MTLSFEILIDHSETSNKCTVLPLSYRPDFTIRTPEFCQEFCPDFLLHPDGQSLALWQRPNQGKLKLGAIDSIWRRLSPLMQKLAPPLPPLLKVPPGFVTAYPRVNRNQEDPEGGLATIEALYIASIFLGARDDTLLREYFFANAFLSANQAVFAQYGFAVQTEAKLYQPTQTRTALTRRLGRGRGGR